MVLSDSFRRLRAPVTGRSVIQLTEGEGYTYPLYYFIPSLTSGARYLVYHRSAANCVQLHRLELATGQSVQLTNASAPAEATHWKPYDMPAGAGVMDHRSVLNRSRNEVIYFDGNDVRLVEIESRRDRLWFRLPPDRIPSGQNCVSADGHWLLYISHDRNGHEQLFRGDFTALRPLSRGTELRARNFDTDEDRVLVRLNSPIHHVFPYDESRILFCHPPAEDGLLLTDMQGGWYSHLHTQDAQGGTICHFVATARGIAYEVRRSPQNHTGDRWSAYAAGLLNPDTHRSVEFALPPTFGYTHTGLDPSGRRWIFESQQRPRGAHELHAMVRWDSGGAHDWLPLSGDWPTYGHGQKSHFHPQILPGDRWLLFVAGDDRSRSNHIHLMDISDLPSDAGVPDPN